MAVKFRDKNMRITAVNQKQRVGLIWCQGQNQRKIQAQVQVLGCLKLRSVKRHQLEFQSQGNFFFRINIKIKVNWSK